MTAGSNEGVLPSFVHNNILETLMDQEDEDLEAFETDLGQVLRDLTVALRDIVENVKENKARKKRPSPKPKPAPNTTLQSSCNGPSRGSRGKRGHRHRSNSYCMAAFSNTVTKLRQGWLRC